MPKTGRDSKSEVILFLSADLAGSTAYKAGTWGDHQYASGRPPWANKFVDFYQRLPEKLIECWRAESHGHGDEPKFIKAIGDEVLFGKFIVDATQCREAMRAFLSCLVAFNAEYKKEGVPLELKGTAWIAGFPINNHRVVLPAGGIDFIGPSIDVGFRLSRFSSRRKLVVSVDLALLLTGKDPSFTMFYDGRESLRGVLGDRAYPIVWIDTGITNLEDKLVGTRKDPCQHAELEEFCRQFIKSCGESSWLIIPYLPKDRVFNVVPARHRSILDAWSKEDRRAKAVGNGKTKGTEQGSKQVKELLRRVTTATKLKNGKWKRKNR